MESNHQYADLSYWDGRFAEEKEFEWLADFESFKHLVLPMLTPDSRILHIGCGTSQMSMQLYEMGFTKITNVDFSQVLVDAGRAAHPEMEWVCDDIRSLSKIPSCSFDVVLEKATLEALLVKEKSTWSPSDSALKTVDDVFKSIALPALLRLPGWSISVNEFGDFFHYFVFIMRRGEETSQEVRDRFARLAPDWSRSLEVTE
ncbi:unnamed protein product [Nippostrongylus brasiliensis]|uniref:Methyltransf_25 domain-containing protein n=1 Tax=Nippostrongylus brasiliensis TaxID=27835 RepID=A0A0N4Y4Y0_NIPBR|nr:unnamed protein product [Nippostrongylus brasiliensis]